MERVETQAMHMPERARTGTPPSLRVCVARQLTASPSRLNASSQASTSRDVQSPSPVPSSPGSLLSTVTGNTESTAASQIEHARPEKRVSYYVLSLDEMLDKVLEAEAFLFDASERDALHYVRSLDCKSSPIADQARYLLVRLYLRKAGWIRVGLIGYANDIDDVHGTARVLGRVRDLAPGSAPASTPPGPKSPPLKREVDSRTRADPNVVDLTGTDDEDDEDADGGGSKDNGEAHDILILDQNELPQVLDLKQICWNSDNLANASPDVVLSLLTMDELVTLGKGMKVNSGKGLRGDWTSALLRTSNQATLCFLPSTSRSKENAVEAKRPAAFGVSYDSLGNKLKASNVVSRRALATIGEVVHLHPSYRALLDRLCLVYHRTSYTSGSSASSFTANLLARFGKRHYPVYMVRRTFSIFASRAILRQYERALEVERTIEEHLGDAGWGSSSAPTPSRAAIAAERAKSTEQRSRDRENGHRMAIALFDEVEGTWRRMCRDAESETTAGAESTEERLLYYRRQFHPGWPLTRVAYKAAGVLARLGRHDREVELLRTLLAQRAFRRGKRGDWWDRLALVMMRYPLGDEAKGDCSLKKKARLAKQRKLDALQVCIDGLADPYTHLIYRSSLQRRILRIESSLDIPKEERRRFEGLLRKASDRLMEGERLDEPTIGRKSVWRATDGSECSVEDLVLEQYGKEGWKGYHSENGILSTIFTLCFWDIIFADVNGAFETEYQSAPLDLRSDAFSIVRRQMIDARLTAIENGGAVKLLTEVDDRERPQDTWAVGVNFAKFTQQDLIEVVECIGGPGLAVLSTHFAEEYGHKTGGMPDLCIWNVEKSVCKFVEVKGPGDKLSETQRVWLDVLLRAGLEVEVCRVVTTDDMLEMDRGSSALGPAKRRKVAPNSDS
ncbi:BQ5605_C003g02330 [Microbotryum silenes-dioicae]|uniref:Fanconi-associated nuclease n=1 Tax=Microbotryum silenes-dioicae TaxID=796604 RepID=A0A2X0P3Z2_9BASI|nr:BQ5605_C003g02330 [Microbotryum silenes-dioicae]